MSERLASLGKNTVIPVSLGLLFALVVGVWALADRVMTWESRLDDFEKQLGSRWSYYMAREAWLEAARLNDGFKAPDVPQIRTDYHGIYK